MTFLQARREYYAGQFFANNFNVLKSQRIVTVPCGCVCHLLKLRALMEFPTSVTGYRGAILASCEDCVAAARIGVSGLCWRIKQYCGSLENAL